MNVLPKNGLGIGDFFFNFVKGVFFGVFLHEDVSKVSLTGVLNIVHNASSIVIGVPEKI